jgi:heat shock protein HslJ
MNGTDLMGRAQVRHRWAGALGAATVFALVVTGCANGDTANPGAGGAATETAAMSTAAAAPPAPTGSTTAGPVTTSAPVTATPSSESSAPTTNGDSTTMSASVPSIEDVTWTLVAALDNSGATVTIPDGVIPTLKIADDRLAVNTGCNVGSGAVAVSPAALEVGPVATTRMACDEARMKLEQTVLAVLSTRSSYRIDKSALTISNSAGTLVYQPGDETGASTTVRTAKPAPTAVTPLTPLTTVTLPSRKSMLPSIPEDPRGSTN